MAHHRAVHAGSVLPFAPPRSSADLIDVLRAQDPSIEVIRRYPDDVTVAAPSPESAMAEVHQAERRLAMARRAASKVFKNAGRDTAGMFGDMTFVPRSVDEAKAEASKPPESEWLREKRERAERAAPKTRAQIEMAEMRSRGPSEPIPVEPQDPEAREQAVRVRWEAATAEERGRMIVEAAARSRPSKRK